MQANVCRPMYAGLTALPLPSRQKITTIEENAELNPTFAN